MLKGCKQYFSMFGMMVSTINSTLSRFLNQIREQNRKSIPIYIDLICRQSQQILQKNQTYQG